MKKPSNPSTPQDNLAVSFAADDAQLAPAARNGPNASTMASAGVSRRSDRLSAVSKMYDLDGDGELNEVEQAMRDMDATGHGYLTNDKVYTILQDQMETQKELFKMKKIIFVITAFVIVLALCNLGTSFTAAYLAKDTSTNSKGELVKAGSKEVIATQSTTEQFKIKRVFLDSPEDVGNENRELRDFSLTSYYSIDHTSGSRIINQCKNNKDVSIIRTFMTSGTTVSTKICPNAHWSYAPKKMTLTLPFTDGVSTEYVIIEPYDDTTTAFNISGNYLTQNENDACDHDQDCDSELECKSGRCTATTENPSQFPSFEPSVNPSGNPTQTSSYSPSFPPSHTPSSPPSHSPSINPTTSQPIISPSRSTSPSSDPSGNPTTVQNFADFGEGLCQDSNGESYHTFRGKAMLYSVADCAQYCVESTDIDQQKWFTGIALRTSGTSVCYCYFDANHDMDPFPREDVNYDAADASGVGTGAVGSSSGPNPFDFYCFSYKNYGIDHDTSAPSSFPSSSDIPSAEPTTSPTEKPSMSSIPSTIPSKVPTSLPSVSANPSKSSSPSAEPSAYPSVSSTPTSSTSPSTAPSPLPTKYPEAGHPDFAAFLYHGYHCVDANSDYYPYFSTNTTTSAIECGEYCLQSTEIDKRRFIIGLNFYYRKAECQCLLDSNHGIDPFPPSDVTYDAYDDTRVGTGEVSGGTHHNLEDLNFICYTYNFYGVHHTDAPSATPSVSPSSSVSPTSSSPIKTPALNSFARFGSGACLDESGNRYDTIYYTNISGISYETCARWCLDASTDYLRGMMKDDLGVCKCAYDDGRLPSTPAGSIASTSGSGSGTISSTDGSIYWACYKYKSGSIF